MNPATESRRTRFRAHLEAAFVMLGAVLAHRAILRAQPQDPGAAVVAAMAMALGVVGITATLRRHLPLPRWGYYASAGILALSLIAGALVAPATESARHSQVWLLPWYMMTMAMFPPRRAHGWCDSRVVAARVAIGTSIVLGAAYVLAARLGVSL